MSMAPANNPLASYNYLVVNYKSDSALYFYYLHPSKVSVASLKAASAALTSYSLNSNSEAHSVY